MITDDTVSVRYMVDDVQAAVDFYTTHFGFEPNLVAAPAFADVVKGNLRLLLSGPLSSAGRAMPDGAQPVAGGWNRVHFVVADLDAEVERLRAAGVTFRNDVVSGPGGRQILLQDPAGNLVELFQPAERSETGVMTRPVLDPDDEGGEAPCYAHLVELDPASDVGDRVRPLADLTTLRPTSPDDDDAEASS